MCALLVSVTLPEAVRKIDGPQINQLPVSQDGLRQFHKMLFSQCYAFSVCCQGFGLTVIDEMIWNLIFFKFELPVKRLIISFINC